MRCLRSAGTSRRTSALWTPRRSPSGSAWRGACECACVSERLRDARAGNTDPMIGTLRSIVLDCRDPRALAAFYAELLGGDVTTEDDTWVVVTDPAGRRVACQYSPQHEPPDFPDPRGSQQLHL